MNQQLTIWEQKEPVYVNVHHPLIVGQFGYLELNTIRLFLLTLSKWDYHGAETTPIRVYFREIIPNYKGGTHFKQGKAAADELKKRMKDVNIEYTNTNGKRVYQSMTVIDFVRYEEGNEYIDITFGSAIQVYLRELKGRFSSAELQELFTLRSYYAIRLYLIGKMFYPGGPAEIEFTIKEIKAMLVGDSEYYNNYKRLKDKALKPGLEGIASTSAALILEEKKTSYSVTSLVFRPATPLPNTLKISPITEDLRKELTDLKVNLKKVEAMIAAGDIDAGFVRFCIDRKKNDTKVKKPGGAIYKAIVNKEEYTEYRKPKPPILTKPKAAAAPEPVYYSEATVLEMYETSKSKKQGVGLKDWVQATFYAEGFVREKLENVWYLIKK